MIEECSLDFLRKVCDSLQIRGFTLFLGDILAAFIDENCFTEGKPDPLKIDPLIMIGQTYCNLKDVVGQPFLEGKKLI